MPPEERSIRQPPSKTTSKMISLSLPRRLWAFLAIPFFWSCSSRPVKTIGNLRNVAASERNAAVRYRSCSTRAREEGYLNVANLFAALACSEEVHVKYQIELLERYGEENISPDEWPVDSTFAVESTVKNLRLSLRTETYESLTAFPIFEKAAVAEGANDAARMFRELAVVATKHGDYCRRVLDKLNHDGSDRNVVNSWSVCPRCGAMYETVTLQENCEMCEMPASTFVLFQ